MSPRTPIRIAAITRSVALASTLAVAFACSVVAPAQADVETGRQAYSNGNPAAALREFLAAAEAGDIQGQFLAGQMLVQGQGVPKDLPRGLGWLEKAAKGGHLQAAVTAGTAYAYGDGIDPDYEKAFGFLRPAAEAGDAHAQNNLAVLYHFGLGTKQDPVQAMAWALRAERQGLLQAISLRQEIEGSLTLAQKSDALRLSNQPMAASTQARAVPLPAPAPPGRPLDAPPNLVQQAQQPRVGAPHAVAGASPPASPPPSRTSAGAPAIRATPPSPPPQTAAGTPDPAPVRPPDPAPARIGGGWAVQLAALPGEDAARKEWQAMQAKHAAQLGGLVPQFSPVDLGAKGVFYRILVGQYGSADEAKEFCATLKKAGRDCLIRKL